MDKTRTRRVVIIIRIIRFLYERQLINSNDLSQRFKLSRRTIFRYMSIIRQAGLEVEFDPKINTYQLHGSRTLVLRDKHFKQFKDRIKL